MLNIALTGGEGMVGSRIIELLKDKARFISLSQSQMDIRNETQVYNTIKKTSFDIFLHLAAYTNVDGAEREKTLAHEINVLGTQNVYQAVCAKKKQMIYISTGFVFDGKNPPYTEQSTPNPLSIYGKTKYEGEKIVRDSAMIVRFDYPYRNNKYPQKKDFVRGIVASLQEGKKLTMVTDSLITPTFVDDIAEGLWYLINHFSAGIFHLVGSESLSPYEAGITIARICNFNPNLIHKTTYYEYFSQKAPRPQYAKIASIRNNFFAMKSFEEGVLILYH